MSPINQMKGVTPSGNIQTESQRKRQIERNSQRFQQLLDQEVASQKTVRFSAHAMQRLEQRDIQLSEEDMAAITRGMDQAAEKGANESLLLYKDLAFIASIRNRTVITAVGQKETRENVFTNIDSAVIIDE